MLDTDLPLTTAEYDEWGNPNEREAFHRIAGYAPYERTRAMPCPQVLATGGVHDSQVGFWEPAKWVQRLRARNTNENARILLRTNLGAGHGGKSGRYASLEENGGDPFVPDRPRSSPRGRNSAGSLSSPLRARPEPHRRGRRARVRIRRSWSSTCPGGTRACSPPPRANRRSPPPRRRRPRRAPSGREARQAGSRTPSQADEIDPGGGAGVAGPVERLANHHPQGVEHVAVADHPEARWRRSEAPRVRW